jgi:hypothetical protein
LYRRASFVRSREPVKTTTKRAEPIRLLRHGGTWSVEYTRLVAVDEHILRPERRRVAASGAALRSLAATCPPQHIAEAVALMGEADDGSERAFELAEDGWTESLRRVSERPHSRRERELEVALAETKAELLVLRGLYDALLARVVVLEGAAALARRSVPPRVVRRVPSRKSVFDSLSFGEPPDTTPPLPAHAETRTPAFAPPISCRPDAEAAETQVSPAGPSLSLPSASDFVACLQMLAEGVPVSQLRAAPPGDVSRHYVAVLTEEASGEALAALLFDERAAAEFGGGILGVAPGERDQQAIAGLTADSLDGLNEVANNLTGLVNRANAKRPLRLGALELGPTGLPAWLANPAKKLALSTRENGSLFLLVR